AEITCSRLLSQRHGFKGTRDQVCERIEPMWQRANSMLILPPSWGLSPEQLAAKTAAITETFWAA
ncbi:MAG: hypothetical protein WB999_10350, partial [Candidatus Binataceae bacterium]